MGLFPTELVLIVLSHLCDDPESLSSCTLVCQGWVPLSRQYLFAALVAKLPPPPSRDLIRLPQSIAELANGVSTRCPYLKELHIYTPIMLNVGSGFLQHSDIFHLVKNLPKLQSLHLQDVSIIHNELDEVPYGLSIDTLELSFRKRLVARPIVSTINTLKLFSNITNLSVVIQHLGQDITEQIQSLPVQQIGHLLLDASILSLRSLQGAIHSQSVIEMLALQPQILEWSGVVALGLIIQRFSSRLVSLKLNPGPPSSNYKRNHDHNACKLALYTLDMIPSLTNHSRSVVRRLGDLISLSMHYPQGSDISSR